MTLSGSTKKYLRGLAHHLKPIIMVGKNGVTDDLINAVNEALTGSELIKIKFLEFLKPWSFAEYTKTENGSAYGIKHNVNIFGIQWKAPVNGLYITGQSIFPGFLGALMSSFCLSGILKGHKLFN